MITTWNTLVTITWKKLIAIYRTTDKERRITTRLGWSLVQISGCTIGFQNLRSDCLKIKDQLITLINSYLIIAIVEGDNLALSASDTKESLLLLLQHNLTIDNCVYRTLLTTVPWFHSRRRSARLSSRIRLTSQSTMFPSYPSAVISYFAAAKKSVSSSYLGDDKMTISDEEDTLVRDGSMREELISRLLQCSSIRILQKKSINTIISIHWLATVTPRTLKILFPIPSEAEYGRTIPSDRIRRGAL